MNIDGVRRQDLDLLKRVAPALQFRFQNWLHYETKPREVHPYINRGWSFEFDWLDDHLFRRKIHQPSDGGTIVLVSSLKGHAMGSSNQLTHHVPYHPGPR